MALAIQNIERVFKHGKTDLDDPNPELSPEAVLTFYSNTYPELTTATISGPKVKDGKAVYEFNGTVGTKG